MKRKLCATILVGLLFLLISTNVSAQIKTWPGINLLFKNQFDNQSRHHGLWRVTNKIPGTEGKIKTKGRYSHGIMVGIWRAYYPNKKLQQLEICSFNDGKNLLETTRFYENGNIETKGLAAIIRTNNASRYYRFGEWLYYDENGNYTKTINYEEGWPVKTAFANGKTEISKPPKVYKPGEAPKFIKKPGAVRGTVDKEGNITITTYKENGDSTVYL